jgi:hypothetical protein
MERRRLIVFFLLKKVKGNKEANRLLKLFFTKAYEHNTNWECVYGLAILGKITLPLWAMDIEVTKCMEYINGDIPPGLTRRDLEKIDILTSKLVLSSFNRRVGLDSIVSSDV